MTKSELVISSLAASILLSGCAASHSGNNFRIPSYATTVGIDGFYVNCLNTRSTVRGRVADLFYTDEGRLKTKNEFCDENTVGSRIR